MIVDLFAGPGGWSEGLRMLGIPEVGVELDDAACATARAAGHTRVQADVSALDPAAFAAEHGPVTGVIASAPCPTFSTAGNGAGRTDVEHVIACLRDLAAGRDRRAEHRARCADERSLLTVEPLRWTLALRPSWVALEQVPPVLPIWRVVAGLLEAEGYAWWTGVLEAERYGVPQTRKRAILMARRDGRPCLPPAATHQRYVPGEPARHDVTLDGEVLPWVSMAAALGWGGVVGFPRQADDGAAAELDGASYRGRDLRDASEPAFNLTEKARSWRRWQLRPGVRDNATVRDASEPAATVAFGHDAASARWVPTREEAEQEPPALGRPTEAKAVRVNVQEAAVLQSFRPDYPWQGSRTAQFRQVGDAVPPLLARAILAELCSRTDLK